MPTLNNATLTLGSGLTVTNNVVTGSGVFDDLMEAVTTHLEAQYQLGRITGGDFATVYLGAMQSALQQSVAYAVGAEKTNADIGISTTGISGPAGGSESKPVGIVYIAVVGEKVFKVKKYNFNVNRNIHRDMTATAALNMVRLLINNL